MSEERYKEPKHHSILKYTKFKNQFKEIKVELTYGSYTDAVGKVIISTNMVVYLIQGLLSPGDHVVSLVPVENIWNT